MDRWRWGYRMGGKTGMTHSSQGGSGWQGESEWPAHAYSGSGKPHPWVSWGRGFLAEQDPGFGPPVNEWTGL